MRRRLPAALALALASLLLSACATTGAPRVHRFAASDPFDLTLDFVSSLTSSQRAAFAAAAGRWEQIVTAGLPDTYASIPAGACPSAPGSGASFPASAVNETVDDVRIDVWVGTIDGAGGILGQGGPCIVRGSDGLTLYGVMQFDAADLGSLEQSGLLEATVLHEMGHVLGIGTLWNWSGRALLTGAGASDPRFVGANAVREWQALGGSGTVPVENCLDAAGAPIPGCGAGTADAHWREAVFGNELMTGYLDAASDPLSRVTVGSLQDLGYVVDYASADGYVLPSSVSALSASNAPRATFLLTTPVGSVP